MTDEDTYFLAWTTTPWTLPGNVALAVGEELDYVKVRDASGDTLILAAELAETVLDPGYEVLERMKGGDLLGMHYEPLYTFYPQSMATTPTSSPATSSAPTTARASSTSRLRSAPTTWTWASSTACPSMQTVDEKGQFKPEVTPWAGVFVKDADPAIQEELAGRGLLYRSGTV